MAILGIGGAGYHDASVSVVDSNGNITFAGHAERYSRLKNDPDLNRALLEEAVASTDEKITEIAWYERPFIKHTRQIYSGETSLFSLPFSPRKYLHGINGDEFNDMPIRAHEHHLSHAAAGFQTSKFETAICLVVDAIGEWDCASIWYAQYENGKARYKKLWSKKYPNSLGLFYSAYTKSLGLKPNEEEYIMMGMAAYGKDPYKPSCIKTASYVPGNYKVTENLHTGLGVDFSDTDNNTKYNIAAGVQDEINNALINICLLAEDFALKYVTRNMVYMGGVALNCVANSHFLRSTFFRSVWIMPNPGDAGSSLGAAALSYGRKVNWTSPFLGTNITGDYPVFGLLDTLMKKGVAGVACGRAEFGPRALGNRSLLADPRGQHMKDKVNTIKKRDMFRPFAPVILAEYASDYFYNNILDTRYMQYVVRAHTTTQRDFPAIVHVDGTSRVQTVDQQDTSGIRALLEQWFFWTGCPMLLNTSLNIKGQPLVNTRSDAEQFEKKYGVDVL